MALWIFVTNKQHQNGTYFKNEYSEYFKKVGWKRLNVLDYNNGECDVDLNFKECKFDGGDCMIENFILVENAIFLIRIAMSLISHTLVSFPRKRSVCSINVSY